MVSIRGSQLRKREPEPGLINLPIPVPSVPILNPIITPLIAGVNPATPPSKPSATQPAASSTGPKPAPPSPAPPASSPPSTPSGSNNSNGGGNDPPSSGGSSENDGGAGSTASSSGSSGNGGTSFPSSSGNPGTNGDNNTPSSQANTPQGDAGSNSPSGSPSSSSSPLGSPPPSPLVSGASGTSPNAEQSFSVSGSMTFSVTPTGMVALPVNNAAAIPSGGDDSPSGSAFGQSGSVTDASGVAIASPSAQGSSHTIVGGSMGTSSGGSDGNSGNTNGNPEINNGNSGSSSGARSHMTAGAIGGIVAAVLLVCLALAFVVVRNRYKRRKDERRVEWINGYISDGQAPDMLQRSNSKRSSWGTPIEYRFSNPFRRSLAESSTESQEEEFDSPPSPYHYDRSETGAPVLPMPVHSPTQDRSRSPEDPFMDVLPSAQPLKRMSSLPLRISLLSSDSGHNPFDDTHEYRSEDHDSVPDSAVSSATFGHGSGAGNISRPGALFPMPPPPAGSSTTIFASPRQTLQTPGILISFPDSPISPSFAAAGTSSYPRRASVRQLFLPSRERSDEVHVEQGDYVSVVSVYEDGWAFVQREKNSERGLVPLTCLSLDNP